MQALADDEHVDPDSRKCIRNVLTLISAFISEHSESSEQLDPSALVSALDPENDVNQRVAAEARQTWITNAEALEAANDAATAQHAKSKKAALLAEMQAEQAKFLAALEFEDSDSDGSDSMCDDSNRALKRTTSSTFSPPHLRACTTSVSLNDAPPQHIPPNTVLPSSDLPPSMPDQVTATLSSSMEGPETTVLIGDAASAGLPGGRLEEAPSQHSNHGDHLKHVPACAEDSPVRCRFFPADSCIGDVCSLCHGAAKTSDASIGPLYLCSLIVPSSALSLKSRCSTITPVLRTARPLVCARTCNRHATDIMLYVCKYPRGRCIDVGYMCSNVYFYTCLFTV